MSFDEILDLAAATSTYVSYEVFFTLNISWKTSLDEAKKHEKMKEARTECCACVAQSWP